MQLSIAIAIDNENLFVKKYRFGFERRSDNGKPIIYLSHNLAPEENISNELTNDVVVKLVVKPHAENILATITFYNSSTKSYFLPRIYYPKNFQKGNGDVFDALCDDEFLITSGNISLDYLGGFCPFELDLNLSRWVEITAGKKISFDVKLNDMHSFLPSLNNYHIKTLNYKLVRRKWFVLKSINETFLSILMKRYSCNEYDFRAISFSGEGCDNYEFDKNTFFFVNQILDKDDEQHSVHIRSNEFSINIDGSLVKQPY
ncbi:TPA: hypothetical protein ORP28_003977 [Escherichia coli]|nr:hypothetical protein [Escherichia coli]HCS5116731.1 hypothetical protein [Escherichia coli]